MSSQGGGEVVGVPATVVPDGKTPRSQPLPTSLRAGTRGWSGPTLVSSCMEVFSDLESPWVVRGFDGDVFACFLTSRGDNSLY